MYVSPSSLPKLPPLDYRIPRWAPENLKPRSCPFCDGHSPALLQRPDDLPVGYCSGCSAWYVVSMPNPEELARFYQDYWDSFRPVRLDARTAKLMMCAARDCSVNIVRNRLEALLGTLRAKRVVDIGCGLGGFLLSLQAAGAKPVGIELSREARNFVRSCLGVPIYDSLPNCLAETGPVDAIVLIDVVEHLEHPVDLLATAVDGLRPGGILALWTPNGGAAGTNFVSGAEWVGFRVDLEHLQYLSTSTVVLLAQQLGLTVEHVETTGFPGLAGIDREPETPSWFRKRLHEARSAIASSTLRPLVRELRDILSRRYVRDRTLGTYNLFTVLRRQ